MKILKNLRNELVRLRNLSSEKTGNLRNSPALEKTHRFLYSDTECIGFFNIFVAHKFQIFVWHKTFGPAQNIFGPVKGQGIIKICKNVQFIFMGMSKKNGCKYKLFPPYVRYILLTMTFQRKRSLLRLKAFVKDRRVNIRVILVPILYI